MSENTANPLGPQYGSGRRDDSPSGVKLPTDFLAYTWDRELANIGRGQSTTIILHHVARAQGFAWALRAADLVNEDTHKAMGEAIIQAELNANARIA